LTAERLAAIDSVHREQPVHRLALQVKVQEVSMAYDEHLVSRIRKALGTLPGMTEKKMFGGIAFLRHGLMFIGVTDSRLMARVGKPLYKDSLAREHVRVMDFTGKPMAGYVYIDEPGTASDESLRFWLMRCLDFVATLPPKTKQ
jgi:TfoX/Sxy family transcriptional regulator of competence genes